MVIPMGGMGTPMVGPPPAELQHRFRIIRLCILAMVFSIFCQVIAGILLNRLWAALLESLNVILISIIGSFLMNDDPTLGKVYQFFMQTCLQSCQDQCQGGMSCLLPFILCNVITAVLNIILNGVIGNIINIFRQLSTLAPVNFVGAVIFLVASIVALTAQIVGAVYGYLAYRDARDSGVTATPGTWGNNAGAGGGGGLARNWRANDRDTEMDQPTARPATGFQAFGGTGTRLGSG
uniref:Uncharacterized protein n=1 Tax=Noctiluca scintillans TaxID=2966 RepID=A0A7S1AVP2_NOCSC|mmetsp:Transcript_62246/g.165253  ORF Transcript_62246/g.165253 Transcript_62246/m.165253 type:complete len:236 (+) Transcript_62246:76-783(+)|eukprot:CAMPEP_0194493976 /NCGR_PEP_ID=MMETSP0253-20130528/12029_1 /TAXON_ID=2966 /ORGANISM="Noctiluca scintillans" /LENGTH=235 /DNA_ID=CAMNT_0039335025 /DNA_START=19 /DNA_END=726 /DNA_ORIENTATION=+